MLCAEPSILRPRHGGPSAVLVRSAANEAQQRELYAALCDAAGGSHEWRALSQSQPSASERPYPLCVWRHPYTQQTNARHKPTQVLDWAHAFAASLASRLRDDGLVEEPIAAAIDEAKYDSLLSVLYAPAGTLRSHTDTDLHGYGLALSLGAACAFDFGGTEVELRSGDALLADFGRVRHAVRATLPAAQSAPAWWLGAHNFGRDRCSLQLRDRAWGRRPHPTMPDSWVRRTVRRVEPGGHNTETPRLS